MNRIVSATAVAIACVFLAAPLAAAEWKAHGTYEPDSRLDSTQFMATNPPPATGKPRIYFNAYPMHDADVGGGIANPNNAVTKSQIGGGATYTWGALLGIWRDCNQDGYVGHAETAVREYRAELLTPPQSAACPAEHKAVVSAVGGRVSGTLIIEFLTIARSQSSDDFVIVDNAALVWGDEGMPFPEPGEHEYRPVGPAPRSCGNTPGIGGPRGTYDTLGGVLNNLECNTGRAGIDVWNAAVPALLGQDWRFNDKSYDQPGHPVGDMDTFGRDDSRQNTYVAWADCTQGPLVNFGTAMGPERQGYGPRAPRTDPQVNANGNVAGTYNDTYESTYQNCRTEAQGDPTTDYDREFYGTFEGATGNTGGVTVKGKAFADFNFFYTPMTRSAVPCGGVLMSQDCGISALNGWAGSSTVGQNSFWSSAEPRFAQVTFPVRDAASAKLTNASFFTFYANVGSSSTLKGTLPGGSGEYGSAFCGSGGYEQTGATQYHYGWNCNKNEWNRDGDGTIKFTQAVPGMPYNLRDVDCFDGTLVKGTPVTVSTQKFSDTPCWSDDLPL